MSRSSHSNNRIDLPLNKEFNQDTLSTQDDDGPSPSPSINSRTSSSALWSTWEDLDPASQWSSSDQHKILSLPLIVPAAPAIRTTAPVIATVTTATVSTTSTSASVYTTSTSTTNSIHATLPLSTQVQPTTMVQSSSASTSTHTTIRNPPTIVNSRLSQKADVLDRRPQELVDEISASTNKEWNQFSKLPTAFWLLNGINSAGQSVMHIAAEKNLDKVVKRLLQLPVSDDLIERENTVGSTPLMVASECGNIEVVITLLAHQSSKMQLLMVNKYGDNALMTAVAAGQLEVVKHLLDIAFSKKQISMVNKAGMNALNIADMYGYKKIAALLRNI